MNLEQTEKFVDRIEQLEAENKRLRKDLENMTAARNDAENEVTRLREELERRDNALEDAANARLDTERLREERDEAIRGRADLMDAGVKASERAERLRERLDHLKHAIAEYLPGYSPEDDPLAWDADTLKLREALNRTMTALNPERGE